MKISIWTQKPSTASSQSLSAQLANELKAGGYKALRVCVAYATVAGVRRLLKTLSFQMLTESWWLVGLDDEITQPGAIELLQKLKNAHLRVASYSKHSARFHPKVYGFGGPLDSDIRLTLVGSVNLTVSAWTRNGEAMSVVESENKAERQLFRKTWLDLWGQGHELLENELEDYKKRYNSAAKERQKLKKKLRKDTEPEINAEILSSDIAEVDPDIARTCWIEGGYITAMGRELEFKAEQGLFFGLDQQGGNSPQQRQFRIKSGDVITLNMVYQKNQMWRLQMNKQIPEVATGLRPKLPDGKLGRSPYVVVFRKTDSTKLFNIEFVKLSSPQFSKLREESKRKGTFGRTTARQYGWF